MSCPSGSRMPRMRQRGRMPHPRPLPESLAGRPFTVSDALAIGVGRDRLDRSDLTAPFIGVRAPAALVIDPLTRVRLALLGCGEHAFSSGASAATVIGIPLPSRYLGATVVEIAVPAPGRAIRRRGVSGRVLRVSAGEVVHWLGVRVTNPARTWCDLAIVLSVPDSSRPETGSFAVGWRRPGRWRLPHGHGRIGEGSDGSEWPCPCSIHGRNRRRSRNFARSSCWPGCPGRPPTSRSMGPTGDSSRASTCCSTSTARSSSTTAITTAPTSGNGGAIAPVRRISNHSATT